MLASSAPLELRLYKRLRGEGPSKRPRTGLHRRPCVSAHVCRARARAQQCTTSTTAVQLYCRALASSVRGFSTMSHLRRRGASLRLAAHHVHGHLATRQPAPPPTCPAPSAGVTLAWAQENAPLAWRHRPRLKPQAITRRRALTKAKPRLCAAGRESAHPFTARAARGKSTQPEQGCVLCLRGREGVLQGEGERRTAPLPMTKEGPPDSVLHADGHGGRGTGQPKDNGMGRTLTAPPCSSRWRRARRSSCPGACQGQGRGVRAKAT